MGFGFAGLRVERSEKMATAASPAFSMLPGSCITILRDSKQKKPDMLLHLHCTRVGMYIRKHAQMDVGMYVCTNMCKYACLYIGSPVLSRLYRLALSHIYIYVAYIYTHTDRFSDSQVRLVLPSPFQDPSLKDRMNPKRAYGSYPT